MAMIDFEFFMLIFLKKYAIIILGGKANKKTLLVIIVMKNKFKSIVTGMDGGHQILQLVVGKF